ncbi:hypothetical protein FOCC_FOCC011399 [Frankliniella occidentalis]|nr:hypothetical protein FOCC_FOCC011399 [Frankliniella occidentalis]
MMKKMIHIFIMMTPGTQKDTDDDTTAYGLLTVKPHVSGCRRRNSRCSEVVYQPRKMGRKETRAGAHQTTASMTPSRACVMMSG